MNMKLKTCQIVKGREHVVDLKSKLIGIISKQSSTVYGDKLIEFMDIYHLNNLRSATVEQLQEYINTYLKQEENTKN